MMWANRLGHEVYVWRNGKLVYKRWQDADGNKTQNSILLNEHWPNVRIETVIPARCYPAEPARRAREEKARRQPELNR